MKVDPNELRRFAAALDDAGAEIDAIEVRSACDGVFAAVPGTGLGTAATQAGEFVEGAYLRMSQRILQISRAAKGSADSYDVEDTEFMSALDGMSRTI